MYYLIYEIKNNKNGKIYIGKHKTKDINDNYMGSGTVLKRSIEKYGIENFTKTILFELETEQEMNDKEAEIVNEEFIKCEYNYNLMKGGNGGWDFVNFEGLNGASKGGIATSKLKHKQTNKGQTWEQAVKPNIFNCAFCDRIIKKEGNLVQHERSFKENPDRIIVKRKDRKIEDIFICDCGKEIRGKASYTRHNNKCKYDRKVTEN